MKIGCRHTRTRQTAARRTPAQTLQQLKISVNPTQSLNGFKLDGFGAPGRNSRHAKDTLQQRGALPGAARTFRLPMEKMKYASQNMPIPGSAQLFTQKKNAVTALVCSWNLRASEAA